MLFTILTPMNITIAATQPKPMTQKEACAVIIKAITNLQDSVSVSRYKENFKGELSTIADNCINDHPPMNSYVSVLNVDKYKKVTFRYEFSKSELKMILKQPLVNQNFFFKIPSQISWTEREIYNRISPEEKKRFDTHVNKIIKEASKRTTNFEKLKYIHDYVIQHTVYDSRVRQSPKSSHTPKGPLLYGNAVCDGYSTTMALLLNKLKIPTIEVEGYANKKALKGTEHSWNLIYLDNHFYYMDATGDDPSDKMDKQVRYKYFLVPQQELAKDHNWIVSQQPKATSTKYLNFEEEMERDNTKATLDKYTKIFTDSINKYHYQIKTSKLEDQNWYREYIVAEDATQLGFNFLEEVNSSRLSMPFSNEKNLEERTPLFIMELTEKLSSTQLINFEKLLKEKVDVLVSNGVSKQETYTVNSKVSCELYFAYFGDSLWNLQLTVNIKY